MKPILWFPRRLGIVLVTTKVDTRAVRIAQWIRYLWLEQEVLNLHESLLCAPAISEMETGNSWKLTDW